MTHAISGSTAVAAVVGHPVKHSLSPLIHNAWLAAAGIDGVYIALSPAEDSGGFEVLIDGLRGGVLRGVNVTLPFKERALAISDLASDAARAAGAANLLLFHADGRIEADNTDGQGLLGAITAQTPNYRVDQHPAVILGAGGAARGAAAALIAAGAPRVSLVNRTRAKAQAIAEALGPKIVIHDWDQVQTALLGAGLLINATALGLEGKPPLDLTLDALPSQAVVMDMVYRPLRTPLLITAQARGHPVIDGLEMLIQQAAPSFQAFFGFPPPPVDVRGLACAALEPQP